jgi:hypothetical protein
MMYRSYDSKNEREICLRQVKGVWILLSGLKSGSGAMIPGPVSHNVGPSMGIESLNVGPKFG